ncbi:MULTISPECIES: alpha-amylase family glycosyl hydrolase [Microbacterium]|uniref:alpha-amylase family glycosyl hydrolase n=1 Tax=Microbacterium TaxID=33882 RepID=UPI00277E098C|nr:MULTISPECIES: alpha-amylase family glycosyl hydrolase [Microbacterium]MDQ1085208.1 cyclomaltodextrinase [Microbacterium sp. SORGH_AS_0344]MDQ1169486.1 cyclomaltodextrinase [Microbacterium proteolyticum]
MPSWPEHVMWWHVYPLGFVGAPIRDDVDPDAAPAHRLERLEPWLDHVISLGLNGLLLGPVFASETHGYDTVDHFRIDPRLGDDEDFGRLVAAARERGIRILLDGVFNHVGRGHPAFRDLTEGGPQRFRGRWSDGRFEAEVFEGHDALVALDHSSPAVADLVVEVMCHWLERGIDGWRLDAAYAVPSSFWAEVLPRVRERFPDAWFLGEVIHGEAARIVEESTMDSLTQYELWQGVWHGIADRNLFELSHAIERHDELLRTFVPQTFVGNHDVTRIASAVGADFVPHAVAVLFTVAGTPSVYAGDEFGWTGVKEERLGGDDAVRPEFPATPGEASADARILEAHQALIALRRRKPWLWRAHTDVIEVANTAIALRTAVGDDAVVVALNIGDEPVALPVADGRAVVAGAGSVAAGRIGLGPRGWAVLEA